MSVPAEPKGLVEGDPAPRQLELGLAELDAGGLRQGPGLRGTAGRIARAAAAWLPAFAAFALFAQISLLGLSPALDERERLSRAERGVAAREAALLAEHERHLRQLSAFEDPMFRARVERARRSQAFVTAPRPLDLPLAPPVAVATTGPR